MVKFINNIGFKEEGCFSGIFYYKDYKICFYDYGYTISCFGEFDILYITEESFLKKLCEDFSSEIRKYKIKCLLK